MFYVYIIQNLINYKLYVGRTNDSARRWSDHRSIVKNTKSKNYSSIHAAINKYGIENFKFMVIESFSEENDMIEAEMFWIEFFRSKIEGYNEDFGGRGALSGNKNPMYGKTHTPEAKIKMSEQRSGSGNVMFGKNHSDEAKIKMSNIAKLSHQGEDNPRALLSNDEIRQIRIDFNLGLSYKELAMKFKIKRTEVIRRIIKKQTYKEVI